MPPQPLPGRWHTSGPPIEDIYAPGQAAPRRVVILRSNQLDGLLALFAQAGREFPIDLDPDATYRLTIERIDAPKPTGT